MIVHLIDGTYELFRHFFGIRRFKKSDPPYGAVAGVLGTVAQMLEGGATHIGVATDHVIESFRNDLSRATRPGRGSSAVGAVYPLESRGSWRGGFTCDGRARAEVLARPRAWQAAIRVEKVCIWTPDKTWRSAWWGSASSRSTGRAA
jgi:hypothetical protein